MGPVMRAISVGTAAICAPSAMDARTTTRSSTAAKTASTSGNPQTTPGSLTSSDIVAVASGEKSPSLVGSP